MLSSSNDLFRGLTDLSHYEGIKAYTVSIARERTDLTAGVVPSVAEYNYESVDGSLVGVNARYTIRGEYQQYFNQQFFNGSFESIDTFQAFAMDGREPLPSKFFFRSNTFEL